MKLSDLLLRRQIICLVKWSDENKSDYRNGLAVNDKMAVADYFNV